MAMQENYQFRNYCTFVQNQMSRVATPRSSRDRSNFTKQLRYAIDDKELYGVAKSVCL